MVFSIRRRTPAALNGHNFQTFFLAHFFSFAIESYIYETNFTLSLSQKYHFLKIDIHQQLRPLTANYLAMFKVISTTINDIKPKLSAKHVFTVRE